MVKQERAARSRRSLVRAAAAHFDRDGYAGTSLSQVSKSAGISLGGLTFHFASKAELAEAVEEEGRAAAGAMLDRVGARSDPPLRMLVELTLELTREIEENDAVRAMMRLARERPGAPQWSAAWLPVAHDLVEQARDKGQLRSAARPDAVAALAVHLVSGAEMMSRRAAGPDAAQPPESAVSLLHRIWRLVLTGILTDREDISEVVPECVPECVPELRAPPEARRSRSADPALPATLP
ncbi:TetR/AcrR family transcriptional regulator [Streptomyces sp. CAU 1734]|uniref:TetR/AcrR family transcriptional regulator n=1 Tax=Streptomyces sp. CAU 1734 TaxID=3140360 RepID=UPI00326132D2